MLKYVYILFYSENVNIIHKFIWYKSIYVRLFKFNFELIW
jgi:hypothetical protein